MLILIKLDKYMYCCTMENQDKTFNTICRICLNHGNLDKMVSLIDTSQVNGLSYYGSCLEDIIKLPMKQKEYLPTNLCLKCKESLDEVAKFITACESSYKKLRKLIKFSIKQDLDGAMVKEVVRQYTLFSQNIADDLRTSNEYIPYQYGPDIIKKQVSRADGYPNIKVEIEVQALNSSSCIDDPSSYEYNAKNVENSKQSIISDVDIFIDSIKKLITNNDNIKTDTNPVHDHKNTTYQQNLIKTNVEQDLTCNVCQKVLATKKTYKTHIQRHGVCRFVCDQCGKGFPINAELVQHQIHTHGAGSQYECDTCSYRAVKKIQLIEHLRLHTGERPYTCEKCGLTFRRKTLYNKHAKFHGEKTIQCDCCPRKFFIRSAMLAHRNSRHNREYIYSCKMCNATYAMAKTVKKHMLIKHGVPRNLQGKVQKIYKSDTTGGNIQKSIVEEEDVPYL